jgi:elongation factor G
MAFQIAAARAGREGALDATPKRVEPRRTGDVITPEGNMGDVVGDLNRRRGMIEGMEDAPAGLKAVKAQVPLAEMFGYATDLRSATQGRASYSMEFLKYGEAPNNVAEAIMSGRR